MKLNEANSPKDVKRDKKAQESVDKKREAAKAAVPAMKEALLKFRRQQAAG